MYSYTDLQFIIGAALNAHLNGVKLTENLHYIMRKHQQIKFELKNNYETIRC